MLDYDHNHDYFGQHCNHNYLTRLLGGQKTKKNVYERFKDSDAYQMSISYKEGYYDIYIVEISLHCKN